MFSLENFLIAYLEVLETYGNALLWKIVYQILYESAPTYYRLRFSYEIKGQNFRCKTCT